MLFGLTAQILGDFTSEGGVVSVDIVGDLAAWDGSRSLV